MGSKIDPILEPQNGPLIGTFKLSNIEFIGSQDDPLLELYLGPEKRCLGAEHGPLLGPGMSGFSNPAHVGNSHFYSVKSLFLGPDPR